MEKAIVERRKQNLYHNAKKKKKNLNKEDDDEKIKKKKKTFMKFWKRLHDKKRDPIEDKNKLEIDGANDHLETWNWAGDSISIQKLTRAFDSALTKILTWGSDPLLEEIDWSW